MRYTIPQGQAPIAKINFKKIHSKTSQDLKKKIQKCIHNIISTIQKILCTKKMENMLSLFLPFDNIFSYILLYTSLSFETIFIFFFIHL